MYNVVMTEFTLPKNMCKVNDLTTPLVKATSGGNLGLYCIMYVRFHVVEQQQIKIKGQGKKLSFHFIVLQLLGIQPLHGTI